MRGRRTGKRLLHGRLAGELENIDRGTLKSWEGSLCLRTVCIESDGGLMRSKSSGERERVEDLEASGGGLVGAFESVRVLVWVSVSRTVRGSLLFSPASTLARLFSSSTFNVIQLYSSSCHFHSRSRRSSRSLSHSRHATLSNNQETQTRLLCPALLPSLLLEAQRTDVQCVDNSSAEIGG